jgi:hypothetical protein
MTTLYAFTFPRAAWEEDKVPEQSGKGLSGVNVVCSLEGKGKMAKTARITMRSTFVEPGCDKIQICYWVVVPNMESAPFHVDVGWGSASLRLGDPWETIISFPKDVLEWIFTNIGELKIEMCVAVVLRASSVALLQGQEQLPEPKKKKFRLDT